MEQREHRDELGRERRARGRAAAAVLPHRRPEHLHAAAGARGRAHGAVRRLRCRADLRPDRCGRGHARGRCAHHVPDAAAARALGHDGLLAAGAGDQRRRAVPAAGDAAVLGAWRRLPYGLRPDGGVGEQLLAAGRAGPAQARLGGLSAVPHRHPDRTRGRRRVCPGGSGRAADPGAARVRGLLAAPG